MKKLILLAGAALVVFTMNAQRIDIGANFMLGLPMGDYNYGSAGDEESIPPGLGLGGGIEANYWVNDAISVGLEVGFISFGENEIDFDGIKIKTKGQIIPISLKAKYHFLEDEFRPFVGLGVGYGMTSRELSQDFNGNTLARTWSQNGLIISPQAGALYQVSDMMAINLSVQYNLLMNSVDGDLETTLEFAGDSETKTTPDMKVDATNYLGINIGVSYTLSD